MEYIMAFKELFDCEAVIIGVKKRPQLYYFQLKENSDKNTKDKLWSEVCEAVVTNWNIILPEERIEKCKIHNRFTISEYSLICLHIKIYPRTLYKLPMLRWVNWPFHWFPEVGMVVAQL